MSTRSIAKSKNKLEVELKKWKWGAKVLCASLSRLHVASGYRIYEPNPVQISHYIALRCAALR